MRPKGLLSFLMLSILVVSVPWVVWGGGTDAEALFKEVSRLRGLPILKPVPVLTRGKDFFRDHYRKALKEQYPPGIKEATERAYVLMGFLSPGADLIETSLDAYLQVVRGVYDPQTGDLYLADWMEAKDREDTLIHELVHALQDQHFDLGSFLRKGLRNICAVDCAEGNGKGSCSSMGTSLGFCVTCAASRDAEKVLSRGDQVFGFRLSMDRSGEHTKAKV